jgi:hypothetical protein
MENVLSTISRMNGDTIVPAVIDKVKQQLEECDKYICIYIFVSRRRIV